MKILRVISHLGVGGVQRQMLLAFRQLRQMGVECEVCCIHELGKQAPDFVTEGFPVHLVKHRGRFDPLAILKLRRLVKTKGFDVVHGQMYAGCMAVNYALAWGPRRAIIVNGYHNQILVDGPGQEARLQKSIHRPDAFLAVGETVRDTLTRLGVPKEKISVVQNGVVGPSNPLPIAKRPNNSPLDLLWMGRFVPAKQVGFLISVVKQCHETGIPVQLTLLGHGPQWNEIDRMVKDMSLTEIVRLPGVSNNVFEWLENADLYVSASKREGFPNALLEACSARRPFMVSDIEPHKEVLGAHHAGFALELDVDLWVRTLGELAQNRNLLSIMSEEALAIGQKHSMEATCRKTLDLYERLVKQ